MLSSLELPIQAQNLIKAYQTSACFHDIYQYITDEKLPSSSKAQNCIRAEALKYVIINNFLLRIDTQKDKDICHASARPLAFLSTMPHIPSSLEGMQSRKALKWVSFAKHSK